MNTYTKIFITDFNLDSRNAITFITKSTAHFPASWNIGWIQRFLGEFEGRQWIKPSHCTIKVDKEKNNLILTYPIDRQQVIVNKSILENAYISAHFLQ